MEPLLLICILVFFMMAMLGWSVYTFYQSKQQKSEWGGRVTGESAKGPRVKAPEKNRVSFNRHLSIPWIVWGRSVSQKIKHKFPIFVRSW